MSRVVFNGIGSVSMRRRVLSRSVYDLRRSFASSGSEPVVKVKHLENDVVNVILNRPSKHNALNMDVFKELTAVANRLRDDKSVRAVILSGEGPSFCSGLDVKSVMKDPMNFKTLLDKPGSTEQSNLAQDVGYMWRQCQFPVICSIHNLCFGGGMQIALGCDFRFASPDSKLSIMEAKWGLVPDMSISVTLRELMSIDKAKELTFTGRIITADEANEINLITDVCDDPFERSLKLANDMVLKSPDAIAAAKVLYNETWSVGADDKKSLDLETELQRKLIGSINQGIASGRNFGVPDFVPYKKRQDF